MMAGLLYAAAHWGKEEACRILVENQCDMDLINKMGQTALDVADEDVLGHLEELQKKQNLLIGEKTSPLIVTTTTTGDNNQPLKPIKSKETLLLEPEKSAPCIETIEPEKVDEVEEGKKDESSCSSEEEDDEDSESETEADKSKPSASVSNSTTPAPTSIAVSPPSSPTNQAIQPAGKVSTKVDEDRKDEDRKDESPASWRLGLRKTGSYGALAEITATKEAQREKDTTGVMRSASSPRLSSSLDNKDKEKEKDKGTRLAYVAPTIPRRLPSTSDIDEKENRDSTALIRSGSYTRRRWDDDLKNSEGSASTNRPPSYQRSTSHTLALGRSSSTRDVPAKSSSTSSLDPNTCNTKPWQPPTSHYQSYSIYRSGSFGRRHEDLSSSSTSPPTTTTTSSSVTSPTGHRGLLSSLGSSSTRSLTSRYWSEESAEREKEKEKERRSYLTPVRDEESESQRKARSRQARQSRRSTQGVTLTDLQEAEKTIGRSRPQKTREEEKEEKEKQDKEKQQEEKKETETKEDDYRSKYRSFEERYRPSSSSSTSAISTVSTGSIPYSSTALSSSSSSLNRPNSLTGITSSYSRSSRDTEKEMDKKEEEKEGEDKSQPRSIRDRRRPREKRRSTGVSFWTQDGDENDPDQQSDSEEGSTKGEPQSDRLSRNESSSSSIDRNDTLFSRGYGESRRTYSSRLDRDDTTDYKKLYEQILAENEKLKAQLRDTDLELADLKLQLEKATQRQERYADRSQLEMEKRERRALERKISEMEEELKNLPQVKQVQALRQIKERLQAENRALSRVLAKLSQSACSQLPAVDL
ncbi:hypothetical protein PFLUV_G00262990 [Perca fluviatilis]|uniref:Protein phosphatase 1 regulatory subunit n=1 Tax=Perca fluviatilis TaxID=8168 RepID=A0A6A5DUE7_PERFL|nr:hypothetical protein PFLUV_G00262990 [Perca fluviatilis]